jgi:HEPN domain-containing protein
MYLLFQGAEKALKAVLYSRDCDGFESQSTDLVYLANCVKDDAVESIARVLEKRLGPDSRMRYPDVTVFPKIPEDVFTEDDVSFALDHASRLVHLVQALI